VSTPASCYVIRVTDTCTAAADEGFQADNRSETKRSRADTGNDGGNTFTFAEENVSRHANGNADGAPHDGGCRK